MRFATAATVLSLLAVAASATAAEQTVILESTGVVTRIERTAEDAEKNARKWAKLGVEESKRDMIRDLKRKGIRVKRIEVVTLDIEVGKAKRKGDRFVARATYRAVHVFHCSI